MSLFDILFEYILLAVFALVSAHTSRPSPSRAGVNGVSSHTRTREQADLPTIPELRHDSCGRTAPAARFSKCTVDSASSHAQL